MARPAAIVLASVALLAGAAALAFSWQPGLATFHDDSASYLVMAQAFSPWHAASPAVAAQMPYEKYPPLFPLLRDAKKYFFAEQFRSNIIAGFNDIYHPIGCCARFGDE